MKAAAEKEIRGKIDSKKPFNYRWEHVQAVVVAAGRLARLTGADEEIVVAAAWLHDVAKEAGDNHPREGAKFARKFLPKTDFPQKKIGAVARTIEDHMGLWRDKPLTELCSQVLWDADKLTKIGLLASTHWMARWVAREKATTTEALLEMGNSMTWRSKTVASMHTNAAKVAAEKRFAAYEVFWAGLTVELNSTDLK